MYIRRKAFSVAIDENGEEKLFSTTEIMSEEAYIEKLYAEAEEKSNVGKKVAVGAGAATGTVGLAAAGSYGADKLADKMRANRLSKRGELLSTIKSLEKDINGNKMPSGAKERLQKSLDAVKSAEKNLVTSKPGKVEKILRKIGKQSRRFIK